jgi:hypothetical protein
MQQIDEMKRVLQAIDELEAKFAVQKAEYENKMEGLLVVLRRLGREMIAELEGLPPDRWPRGVAPAEGSVKLIPPQK